MTIAGIRIIVVEFVVVEHVVLESAEQRPRDPGAPEGMHQAPNCFGLAPAADEQPGTPPSTNVIAAAASITQPTVACDTSASL